MTTKLLQSDGTYCYTGPLCQKHGTYNTESILRQKISTVLNKETQEVISVNIGPQLFLFRTMIEEAIIKNGLQGKESIIRSSTPIQLIHESTKTLFKDQGIKSSRIHPPLGKTKPELKIAGLLKQKDQDVCITPANTNPEPIKMNWGALSYKNLADPYGFEYSEQTITVNIRSQMSSLAKNEDTIFERIGFEALNLHSRYPNMVMGEVFLIPTHEYNEQAAKENRVAFKSQPSHVENYVNFFHNINNRGVKGLSTNTESDAYKYERCALLIVDFEREIPKIYSSAKELKQDKIIPKDSKLSLKGLDFHSFAKDLNKIYAKRFGV